MPEDRVIEEIRKAINDKEKTDKRMSYGRNILILLFFSIIIGLGYLWEDSEVLLIGLIPAIIFSLYVCYSLIKTEEHFKRERKLLSNLLLFFEGKIDESRISHLRNELRDRENDENEKDPILWSLLMFIPFLGLYVAKDFIRHDKREALTLRYLQDAMESIGIVFLIPKKPQSQEIPKINYILYLILTILTLGVGICVLNSLTIKNEILAKLTLGVSIPGLYSFAISNGILTILTLGVFGTYWLFLLFKDPNIHFESQKEWEERLLDAIQNPVIISPSPSDVTTIYTETKVYDETKVLFNAELILPKREIEITQNEIVFGRSDFETDLSEEYLSYITNKGDGRYHFMITRKEGRFYIEDDKSTNGTKLNDTEIKGRGKKELKNGDKITLAGINDLTITFKT